MSQPVDDDLHCFDFDGTLTSTNALHQLCIFKYFYYPQVIRQLWVFIFIKPAANNSIDFCIRDTLA